MKLTNSIIAPANSVTDGANSVQTRKERVIQTEETAHVQAELTA